MSRKDVKEQAALQPVPTQMDTDVADQPSISGAHTPRKFPPMSVLDQGGRKVDFRRVSYLD